VTTAPEALSNDREHLLLCLNYVVLLSRSVQLVNCASLQHV
jgi:hypothetical protein